MILSTKHWSTAADANHHINVLKTSDPELAVKYQGRRLCRDMLYEIRPLTPTTIQDTGK
jgi:hypothetical protein